jgi:hypothetical protein
VEADQLSQDQKNNTKPECYGVLEKVFPQGENKMRQVPDECWDCYHRVECLKQAVSKGSGHKTMQIEEAAREEKITGGVHGFFKRWSRLKSLNRGEDKK